MTLLEQSSLHQSSTLSSTSGAFERQTSILSKIGFSGNKPVKVQHGSLRFIITDSPAKKDLQDFSKGLSALGVKHVCRAADLNYSTSELGKLGIQVHEMNFDDGCPPPTSVLNKWLNFVEYCFLKPNSMKKARQTPSVNYLNEKEWVAVQCVAGLGRGPLLVAVALVEYCGHSPRDAVELIRKERRGAINQEQFKWLEAYKPTRVHGFPHCQCTIC